MQRTYCYVCGDKLKSEKEGTWWCDGCQQQYFDNPIPCVELALFDSEGRILLTERGRDPNKGKFDLPGGFIDDNETAENALTREMKEELGLNSDQISRPRYVLSYVGNYPYGKVVYETLIFVFTARLKQGAGIEPQDDVASAKFVQPYDIDRGEIAAPSLPEVIGRAKEMPV